MASFRLAFFRLFMLEFRLFVWRVSLFRLFAWRYFVFSHGVISSFRLFAWRLFVFSRGVISGRKDEKTKWHNPATIHASCQYLGKIVEIVWIEFYRWLSKFVEKYNVSLRKLLPEGISVPEFYGDLIYRIRKNVWKSNFSNQSRKLINR